MIIKLKSITLAEYLVLEDKSEYDFAIKYSKQCEPKDILNFGDMTKMEFGDVKDYQYMMQKNDVLHRFIKKVGIEKIASLNVFDFFSFFNYVIEQIGRINKIESELLNYYPSDNEVAAGLERFSKYGNIIQVDSLAHGRIWMYNKIRKTTYEDCLLKLSLEKDRSEYQKDYQKVISRRNG